MREKIPQPNWHAAHGTEERPPILHVVADNIAAHMPRRVRDWYFRSIIMRRIERRSQSLHIPEGVDIHRRTL